MMRLAGHNTNLVAVYQKSHLQKPITMWNFDYDQSVEGQKVISGCNEYTYVK